MSIDAIRENYDYPPLLEKDANVDPIEQFRHWFEEAWRSDTRQPNAMTLATCSLDGVPSARVVLLKGFDHDGFVFFTNYQSAKAQNLDSNPRAELVFHWPQLARTVRVAGNVSRVAQKDTDAYFSTRPRDSQLGAWASDQSRVIPDRDVLRQRLEQARVRFKDQNVPTPPHWGGYRVLPTSIEFWQGQANRLHDRLRYVLDGHRKLWKLQRLSP